MKAMESTQVQHIAQSIAGTLPTEPETMAHVLAEDPSAYGNVRLCVSRVYVPKGEGMGREWSYQDGTLHPGRMDYGTLQDPSSDEEYRVLVAIEWLGGSDYSGGCISQSNARVAEKIGEEAGIEIFHAPGGYGTYQVLIPVDSPAHVWESLKGLRNYPILDEMDWSKAEDEAREEAWKGYGLSDFKRLLLKRAETLGADEDLADFVGYDATEESLRDLAKRLEDETGDYGSDSEGEGYTLPLEKWAKVATLEDLKALKPKVEP